MQLVAKPQQFDVMVMPNLCVSLSKACRQPLKVSGRYGSIISNIGAALVGGPGLVPGANIGREYALFEPGCRHVAKDIMVRFLDIRFLGPCSSYLQGKDVANPAAMILSAAMMLRHLGLDHHANQISHAVYDVISSGKIRSELFQC